MSSETSRPTDSRGSFGPTLGRYFPESLVNALLLGLAALAVTIPFLDPLTQLELFATGFYELFTLQMLLILFWVVSASVVESPRVGAFLDWLTGFLPTSQAGIIYTTGFLSLLLGWVNWAFGLIGGVLVGQRLCRRAQREGTAVHYPLVLTAGLLALVLTNQGLSSPGALIMADETGLANVMLDDAGAIRLSEFVLHPVNLLSSAIFLVTLPLLLVSLAPSADGRGEDEDGEDGDISTLDEGNQNLLVEHSISDTLEHYSPKVAPADWTLGDRLENSELITAIAVVIGLVSAGWHFATGGDLTLPWLAFTLIVVGLAAQGPPMAYRDKTEDATKWANHVAIPFLLYAAVFALLGESGLYGAIGDALAGTDLPYVASFVVAFVLGLLIPDPGSLWVIQGPAIVGTELELVTSLVAVMYGAGISNLWLAFLFASILSIPGFEWREFVRYAAVVTGYMAVVILGLLLVF